MNEKIRELEKQAIDALRHKPFSMEQFREKFAEVIVRECMRMCDVAQVGYLTHGHTLQGQGCQGAKRYISDWFEVEE